MQKNDYSSLLEQSLSTTHHIITLMEHMNIQLKDYPEKDLLAFISSIIEDLESLTLFLKDEICYQVQKALHSQSA